MAKQKGNSNNPNPSNLNNPTNPKTPQKKQKGTGEEAVSSTLAKLEKERKQLLVQIAQIKKTITNHDKADKGELDKIIELEKTRKKNIKEYHEVSQKITKLKREQFDLLKKTEKIEKDRADRLKEEENSFKTVREYNKELEGIQERSVSLMRSMTEETQNQSKLMGLTVSNTKALADEIKDANLRSTKSVSINESFSKTMEGTVNIAKELDSIETKVAEGIDNLGQRQYEMIDLYTIERDLKQQIALVDMNADKMGAKRAAIQKNVLQSYTGQLQRIKSINSSVAKQSQEMYKTKQSAVDTEKAMAGIAAAAPAKNFSKDLEKSEKSSKTISDRMSSLKDKLKGAFEFTVNFLSGAFSFIKTILSFFFSAAIEIDKLVTKVGVGLNITRNEAIKVTKQFADMAMNVNLVGVNAEQFLETTKELTDSFGIDPMKMMNSKEAVRNIENMTILREKFQLTNEESQKFFELSVMHGKSMDEMVMRVDKMSKGIMNSRAALKALAAVPKSIQVNMKNSLNDLIKFANKAKILGMEMDQFKSSGDFLMDIEASLEKQMESQAVTGVYIKDMDAIRLAFYEGQADKALDLLDRSMGSLEEFRNLRGGIIGQKLFAQQFGFEVEEFVKMLTRKDAVKALGLSMRQAAELEKKNAKELFEMSKQYEILGKKGLAEYTKKLGLEKQNAELTQRYEDYMAKVRLQLMTAALPVLKVLHQILDEFINSQVFKDLIEAIQPMAGTIATLIKEVLVWGLKGIRYVLDWFKELTAGGKSLGQVMNDMLQKAINMVSKLFGGGEIFPTGDIKEAGNELDKTNSKAESLKSTFSGFVSSGIKEFFVDLKTEALKAFNQNKTFILVAGGLLILWKVLTMFSKKGGGMGMASSLLALAGAVWAMSDAAEKLAKAGTAGQVGLGVVGALIGGIMYGLKAMKGAVAAAGEIAVVVGTIYAIAGAVYAFAYSAELFANAAYKTAKSFEIIQGLDWKKIYQAADAMDEFFKKMGKGEDVLMKSWKESFLGMFGSQSPLEKIVDFIARVNMNRIMAFSGTMKHLALGLKSVSEALKTLDNSKIDSLWDLGKALEKLSKSMSDSGGMRMTGFFGILHVMKADKIIGLSNAIFYMAQAFESVANSLNRVDISKLNNVSLKMQGQEQKKDRSFFGTVSRLASAAIGKFASFFGAEPEERGRPIVSVPQPMFTGINRQGGGGGVITQTQNININTSALEKKLDTMISLLNGLSTQKAQIKFGEKFIDEVYVQLNGRRDLDANVDNSAGRFLKR